MPAQANFVIQNDGETPAYDVQYLAGMLVLSHPLPNNRGDIFMAHPNDTRRSNQTLFRMKTIDCEAFLPGGEGMPGTKPALFEKEAFDFATTNPDYRLYVAGIVFYRDTFGFKRKTRFAAFLEGDELKRIQIARPPAGSTKQRPAVMGKIDWSLSHAHNDAT